MWGNNIFVFLGSELDSVMVGGLLGTTALGLYQMANRIAVYLTRENIQDGLAGGLSGLLQF